MQVQAGTHMREAAAVATDTVASIPELQQASAELSHAQSIAVALTEDASHLLQSTSASSASLGDSLAEATIADLLQLRATQPGAQDSSAQTLPQQPGTAHARVQASQAGALKEQAVGVQAQLPGRPAQRKAPAEPKSTPLLASAAVQAETGTALQQRASVQTDSGTQAAPAIDTSSIQADEVTQPPVAQAAAQANLHPASVRSTRMQTPQGPLAATQSMVKAIAQVTDLFWMEFCHQFTGQVCSRLEYQRGHPAKLATI